MKSVNPNEFYAERGLVRSSITYDRETADFLADQAKELSDEDVKVMQGEIVILLARLLREDQTVKTKFDEALRNFKSDKFAEREALKEKKKQVKKLMKEGKLDHLLDNQK